MGKVIDIHESSAGPEIEGNCNVVRKGKRCKYKAGWGTDHPGFGPCKHHMGCTPSVSLSSHKEAAVAHARSLAGEMDINPVEALLWGVRLGAGAVDYWRGLLTQEDLPIEVALAVENSYGMERDRMVKTAAICIQAGLAEKRIRLAERQGEIATIALMAALEKNGIKPDKAAKIQRDMAEALLALTGMQSA
jgi:hypothetical protein